MLPIITIFSDSKIHIQQLSHLKLNYDHLFPQENFLTLSKSKRVQLLLMGDFHFPKQKKVLGIIIKAENNFSILLAT